MHILMYAERAAGLGGIETHIATLAQDLAEAGEQVTVAFPRIGEASVFDRAVEAGAAVVEADPPTLLARLVAGEFDVLHIHSSGAARLATEVRRKARIPVVATLHGPDQSLAIPPAPGTRVIAVSPEVAAGARDMWKERLRVIENGVDLRRFRRLTAASHARPAARPGGGRAGLPGRGPRDRALRAVYLGRVGPAKRAGVESLHQALSSRTDVEVTYLCDWAPGGLHTPCTRVEEHLAGADLVFSTGRGVREAMACGAAACVLGVYWDGPVTEENVEELAYYNFSGRASRRPPSAAAIATAVRDLLFDRARLAELKRFSREYAARRFDSKAAAEATRALYVEALNEVS